MHRTLIWIVSLCGLACMSCSVFGDWFVVPTGSVTDGGLEAIQGLESRFTPFFKCATLIVCVVVAMTWALRLRARHADAGIAVLGMVMLLFFPYAVIVWEPELSAKAGWLQMQHENLTWLGGDVYRAQEYKLLPTKLRLYISDVPRQLTVLKLPSWSIEEFGLHRVKYLVQWLGYTNTFCQFVAPGWFLALLGNVALLLACLFEGRELKVMRIRTQVQRFAFVAVVSCGVAWSWPICASRDLSAAARDVHRGHHANALEKLGMAGRLFPPLQQDTWFVVQLGLSEYRAGRDTSHARLYQAGLMERGGQKQLANDMLRQVMAQSDTNSAVYREACRGLLRQAIRSLNSGHDKRAIREFESVLRAEPCNIKALYSLQMAHARLGHSDLVDRYRSQMEKVYSFASFPNRKVVLAAAAELAFITSSKGQQVDDAFRTMIEIREL